MWQTRLLLSRFCLSSLTTLTSDADDDVDADALHVSLAVLFVRVLFLFVLRFRVSAALEQQSNRAVEQQQQQQHFAKWTGWRSLIAKFNCRYAACAALSLRSLWFCLSVCCSRTRHLSPSSFLLCLPVCCYARNLALPPRFCSARLPACLSVSPWHSRAHEHILETSCVANNSFALIHSV